jgi:ligand-binding sensor domain-containing protein/two-component sensor histidine kinase
MISTFKTNCRLHLVSRAPHALYGRLIVLLLLCCSITLQAQRLPTGEAISIKDGLGFRDVTAITQDVNGLQWIGTRQGLNRYDGYRFIKFGKDSRADVVFPGDYIFYESTIFFNDSTLCLIADRQLLFFNIRNFICLDMGTTIGIHGDILHIKKSIDQSLWIVWEDEDGQYLWRMDKNKSVRAIARVEKGRREFTSLAIDTLGNAWWSSVTEGLKQFSTEGQLLHAFKPDHFNWFGTEMYFTPIYIDSRNRIFIFPKSTNEVWHYHPESDRIEIVASNLPSTVYCAKEDKLGQIWFSTKTQLFRWTQDNILVEFTSVLKDVLSYSMIQSIYEDQSQLMWIATDNGLVKFPNQKQLFENKFDIHGEEWGNAMRGIFDDRQGRIYAYCEVGQTGLHRFDPVTGQTDYISLPNNDNPDNSLFGGTNQFISELSSNSVWALNDQLIKTELEHFKTLKYEVINTNSKKYNRNPLYRLRNGQFILGRFFSQLIRYDPESNQKTKLINDDQTGLLSIEAECFMEGPEGTVWVGTYGDGLYQIDEQGKVINHFSKASNPAISNDHILSLYQEGDSVLWMGTFGGGLNQLHIQQHRIKIFTQDDGLANDNVTAILADQDRNIWASTYFGLSCFLQREGVFRNYYEEDGLTNNEFNYASSFKDRNGELWFGGMNGVQSFKPKDIISQQVNPPLVLTGFLKYNRSNDSLDVQVRSGGYNELVTISPFDSYVQFEWTLPNYLKPEQSKYYVWLEGLEDDWSYIGHQPVIRYHKLPAGKYTLHIKGSDSKGNWSSGELMIPIKVNQIFFKTWWFIATVILMLGVLVYSFVHYRLQRLLEMERMRTRIAGDLHDEVGSMLSGLAMQAEIMELDQEKSNVVRLHRISEISRMTLSKMRDVVWSIDSRRDQVKDLVDRMRENAEEMLTPKDIIFHFEFGELPLEKKLQVDVRQHLFLFYKEAINNIAKHSNGSHVTIRFGQFAEHFELSIHDNGTSSATNQPSSGFGLQNLEMRAKKLGATFFLHKEDGFKVGLQMKSL